MEVTVVVATFGDPSWATLAHERAIPSVGDAPFVFEHGRTLHEARNDGLIQVETPWVCFLDADDELEPGYFEAMALGSCELRAPAVRYVSDDRSRAAYIPKVAGHTHRCEADCLAWGNWMVIGTVAPTRLVRAVGGFRDFSWSEDWDLWVRCWKAGATIEAIPEAIYRAHVRPDSRNRAPERETKHAQHQAIARANGLPVPT